MRISDWSSDVCSSDLNQSGWIRGRNQDGSWATPFNPYKWGDAFTEGNALHYSWAVMQDVQGLMNLMGGREKFVERLDAIFTAPPIFDESYYGQIGRASCRERVCQYV